MNKQERELSLLERDEFVKKKQEKQNRIHRQAFEKGAEVLRNHGLEEKKQITTYAGGGLIGTRTGIAPIRTTPSVKYESPSGKNLLLRLRDRIRSGPNYIIRNIGYELQRAVPGDPEGPMWKPVCYATSYNSEIKEIQFTDKEALTIDQVKEFENLVGFVDDTLKTRKFIQAGSEKQ